METVGVKPEEATHPSMGHSVLTWIEAAGSGSMTPCWGWQSAGTKLSDQGTYLARRPLLPRNILPCR